MCSTKQDMYRNKKPFQKFISERNVNEKTKKRNESDFENLVKKEIMKKKERNTNESNFENLLQKEIIMKNKNRRNKYIRKTRVIMLFRKFTPKRNDYEKET